MKLKLTIPILLLLSLPALGQIHMVVTNGQEQLWMQLISLTNTLNYHTTFVTNAMICNDLLMVQLDDGRKFIVTEESRTNIIKFLVSSGEVCRVRGHVWQEEIKYEWIDSAQVSYPEMNLPAIITYPKIVTSPPTKRRKCSICGLVQTKQPGEWK